MSQEFNDFLQPFSAEVQNTARKLRALVLSVAPGIAENIYPKMKVVRYGLKGNQLDGIVYYIAPLKSAVNFGFYLGAKLSDPTKLLDGTGKMLRHVKVKNIAEAEAMALRSLVKAALEEIVREK